MLLDSDLLASLTSGILLLSSKALASLSSGNLLLDSEVFPSLSSDILVLDSDVLASLTSGTLLLDSEIFLSLSSISLLLDSKVLASLSSGILVLGFMVTASFSCDLDSVVIVPFFSGTFSLLGSEVIASFSSRCKSSLNLIGESNSSPSINNGGDMAINESIAVPPDIPVDSVATDAKSSFSVGAVVAATLAKKSSISWAFIVCDSISYSAVVVDLLLPSVSSS